MINPSTNFCGAALATADGGSPAVGIDPCARAWPGAGHGGRQQGRRTRCRPDPAARRSIIHVHLRLALPSLAGPLDLLQAEGTGLAYRIAAIHPPSGWTGLGVVAAGIVRRPRRHRRALASGPADDGVEAVWEITEQFQAVIPRRELDRARYEANRAERAFMRVEPEHRLVARMLKTRCEAKLAALAEAEAEAVAAHADRGCDAWCIPWDAQTQEIYRQKVADSFRLKPRRPAD
ncbi:hypothetical protein V6U90_21965 [Micromonospora sp. CPCC 206060]|uniref:hypothetical protein n=1 Tax=Micromonospora sp. CPCC 206060 TaxID=3122406 RepID=UPI002FF20D03